MSADTELFCQKIFQLSSIINGVYIGGVYFITMTRSKKLTSLSPNNYFPFLEYKEISNNMIAYLSDFQCQEEAFNILSFSINALGALTIIHLFAIFLVIKFILSRKYSESIRNAEEYNPVSKFSVLGFKKLLLYLTLLCFCIMSKSVIHYINVYDTQKTSSPPPVTVMSNLMASLTCFYFVCSKQKIRELMKRRVRGYLESLFPSTSMNLKSRKIAPTLNNII